MPPSPQLRSVSPYPSARSDKRQGEEQYEQHGVMVAVGAIRLHGDSVGKIDSMANERCGPCLAGILARPMFGLVFLMWHTLTLLEK
jgi:hypothetical protein